MLGAPSWPFPGVICTGLQSGIGPAVIGRACQKEAYFFTRPLQISCEAGQQANGPTVGLDRGPASRDGFWTWHGLETSLTDVFDSKELTN